MNMFLSFLLALCAILLESQALASHFKGGELVYQYLGSGQYRIRAYTYWTSGCSVSFSHTASNVTVNTALAKTSDTTINGTQECIYEETVTYASSGEDTISFGSCCRVSGNNFSSSNSFGFSTKIIYNASNDSLNSSSPVFGSKPFYNFSSTAGAINFSLNASLPAGPSDKTWAYRRFSLATPVGVANTVYSNMTGLSINALNGTVSWTSPALGLWLVNVKVEETDSNGTLTGAYIFRDFMLTVQSTSNTPPTIAAIASSSLSGRVTDPFSLTVTATDANGDNITLTATGAAFSNGATFTQNTTGSSVTGTVTWTTPVSGLYAIQFTATDNNAVSLFSQLDATIAIDVPLAVEATLNCTTSPCTGTLQASDPNGLALTYSISTQPSHGTITITNASTGTFTYTPSPGYNGTDVFAFRVFNGTSYSNHGTITATVSVPVDSSVLPDFLALGESTSCLVLQSGRLTCWGDGTLSKIPSFTSAFDAILSAPSSSFAIDNVSQLTMGRRHGCILRTNGEIACFGESSEGQPGNGTAPASSGGMITVSGFGN